MLSELTVVLPTPATALWSPLYAAYYLFLQGRVAYHRIAGKTLMGNLLPENRSDNKVSDVDNPDPLYLSVRSQQNFAENVRALRRRFLFSRLETNVRSHMLCY